jgi:hypothetical protein
VAGLDRDQAAEALSEHEDGRHPQDPTGGEKQHAEPA